MGLRKTVKTMNDDIQFAFNNVSKDIRTVFNRADEAHDLATRVRRQLTKTHFHSLSTGEKKPTILGRLQAIEKLLGVEYEVKPARKIPVQVVATTPKKKGKK